MEYTTPQHFDKGWYELTTGSGFVAYTFSGEVVEVDANGADKASVSQFIQARGGDVVEVKVQARNLDRYGGTATIFINSGLSPLVQNVIEVASKEWKEYTLRIAVPLALTDSMVQVGFGVFGDKQGAAQFSKPKINTKNGGIGAGGVILKGLIRIDTGGSISINTNFTTTGVGSVVWNSSSNVIDFTLDNPMVFEFDDGVKTNKFLPNIQITPTSDNMATAEGPVTWAAQNHQSTTGAFQVQGILPSGAVLDADTMPQASLFFHITVTI